MPFPGSPLNPAELARRVAELSSEKRRALEAELRARAIKDRLSIPPRQGTETEFPLSFAQQRLWFLDRLQPGNTAYNVPIAIDLTGEIDQGVLARALVHLVRRHETLRTTFAERGDVPVQVIAPPGPLLLPKVDLARLPPGRARAEADRLAAADAERPFDLAAGPLFRPLLL